MYLFTWYHQHMTEGSISSTNNHTVCMLPKPKQETRALVQLFCAETLLFAVAEYKSRRCLSGAPM